MIQAPPPSASPAPLRLQPLSGLRVIDVGNPVAGPYTATVMGEFGVDVIKVKHPSGGDPTRRFGTATDRPDPTLNWLSESRNKRSVTIDLLQPKGVALFLKLIKKSDVLVENFLPGTMESWGLTWDALHAVNSKFAMLRVTGFGQTGAYKDRPGFARVAHAAGGLAYLAGMPKDTPMTPGSTTLGDSMTGLYGCPGVMLALRHGDQSGEGQYVDSALYESVFRCTEEMAPAFAIYGVVRERAGSSHNDFAVPHGHFSTKEGKWVAIRCATDLLFERLARAMGRPELATVDTCGERKTRLSRRHDVNEIVRDRCGALTRQEVLQRCYATDTPAGPLNNSADIFGDRQFHAHRNLVAMDAPDTGEQIIVPAPVPRLSETPGSIRLLGPKLGEYISELLRELLGLDEAQIAALGARKVN